MPVGQGLPRQGEPDGDGDPAASGARHPIATVARRGAADLRRARRTAPHRGLVYFQHALLHPWHLLVVAVATVAGVLCWSWTVPIAMIVAAEVLVLGGVPRLHAYRRYIDIRLAQAERAAAAEARAALLQRMEKEHRHELERLEGLADKIRERVRPQGTSPDATDDWLGIGRLTACYVPLAIAYRASKECLAATDREALADEIRVLRATQAAGPERMQGLTRRRLEVAERRASQWDASRADLEAIAAELALIAGILHLTHEQCAAPVDLEAASDEIDRVVTCLEENEHTLRELSTLCVSGQEIEPRLLEMGRELPRPARPRPQVVWQAQEGGFVAREDDGRARLTSADDVFRPEGRAPTLA